MPPEWAARVQVSRPYWEPVERTHGQANQISIFEYMQALQLQSCLLPAPDIDLASFTQLVHSTAGKNCLIQILSRPDNLQELGGKSARQTSKI